jgi:hypothetical protein
MHPAPFSPGLRTRSERVGAGWRFQEEPPRKPVVIMEAMATPAGDIHLHRRNFQTRPRRRAGRLVPSGDVEALVEIIRNCAPEILQKMLDTAFEQGVRFHNVDTESAKLTGSSELIRPKQPLPVTGLRTPAPLTEPEHIKSRLRQQTR